MISLDTETSGVDFHHGCRPFFVTSCDTAGKVTFWEWDVDPLTREVHIPLDEAKQVRDLIVGTGSKLILQNAKFDVAALRHAGIVETFPWLKVCDTLIAGHLLDSNKPHDLTSMVMQHLQEDLTPLEEALRAAVDEARRFCRAHLPDWKIAKKDMACLPSAKDELWRNDYWLPRTVARFMEYPEDHPWWTVLSDYANGTPEYLGDSPATIALWQVMWEKIKDRKLEAIYWERMKALPIAAKMEWEGITLSKKRLEEQVAEYSEESERLGKVCVNIAEKTGHELVLPKGGNNKLLTEYCFGESGLRLPAVKRSPKTGVPSLDKEVIENYVATLPPRSKQLTFVQALADKRKRDTAVTYMEGYQRFWIDTGCDIHVLHPNLNPTGTATLRWSSNNPNEQNISKKEGFNLRYTFGPRDDEDWYSMDGKNLELRIPSFEGKEEDLMEVFLKPDKAPYYGSYHLVVFDLLYPELFAKHGAKCKDLFDSTFYQWVKNGNFAVIYGAQEATADATYHFPGAYALTRERFPKIAALSDRQLKHAEKYGYVETIPDKSVDPTRGYPILCSRTEWGGVKPTVPLNYHIQSTAMWWTMKAMIRCQEQLDAWNRQEKTDRYRIVMQVHDELVFALPRRPSPIDSPKTSNLARARILRKLMEQGGDDIDVPTPVGMKWHPNNWAEGIVLGA